MKQYNLSIQHPVWGHSVNTFTSKKKAVRAAFDLRKYGSSWTDTEFPDMLTSASVVVTEEQGDIVYNRPFTKKYISTLRNK